MSRADEDARRRRGALVLLVSVAALFVVTLVALALGQAVVAGIGLAAIVVAWFVARGITKG